jgi:FkbH-like protein
MRARKDRRVLQRTRLRNLLRRLGALDESGALTPYLLAACDRVGRDARALGRPELLNLGRISIGDRVVLDSREAPVLLRTARGGEIELGSGVSVGCGSSLSAESGIHIGEGTRIAAFVRVRDHTDDGRDVSRVVVGDRVVIGTGARLEAGARIGEGAEILPGAIVRGTVAPFSTFTNSELAPERVDRGESSWPPVSMRKTPSSPITRHSAVIIADFTADGLVAPLAQPDFDGLCLEAEVAPFGQMMQTLRALAEHPERAPAVAVVWTLAEQISTSFRRRLEGERVPVETLLADVDAFATLVKAHARAARFIVVPTLVTRSNQRGFGMREMRVDGVASALMRMNLRLAEALGEVTNVFVMDAQRWTAGGAGDMNPKLWHMGKVPFATEVFAEAARDVKAALRGAMGLSRKLLVLDLDDTLWGGILGDVGWENLVLGGHHPEGEAFVEFQQRLLGLSRQGITLAIVSKNEEEVALEALRLHPEVVLRPEAFAAHRINRRDKAANVAELAAELNLGLSSFVFIDDNPAERSRVREALPEVYVPEWPSDPTQYVQALASLRCFDSPNLSDEDVARTAMYAVDRRRDALKVEVASFEDWLEALELQVSFEPLRPSNLMRATQLLNKTNQMNLRTRRLSELELLEWSRGSGREVWTARVSDRLGDAGLTGIVSVERRGAEISIEDYVLSCRVMGRRVEETLLWAAVERARKLGGLLLVANPIPTTKNKPCLDFLATTPLTRDRGDFVWRLADPMSAPEHVRVLGLETMESAPPLRAAQMGS